MTLPLMGRVWSYDSAWDIDAMSKYNTITSVAESPQLEGLLYVGTDDGLVQVSENGGESWRPVEVGSLPGVPETAFVNDLKADLHQAGTVYVALDNHKLGDFKPYLLKSVDRGRSWRSIAGDLPDRHLVWRIVQDHVKADLLFAATELGIFFTVDGGSHWVELNGNVPTISFRDLAIQRRENDLVGASFGRGFFVLDDYSPLREVNEQVLGKEAALFPIRRAWWYVQRHPLGQGGKAAQGGAYFTAPNPPFGAVFTYHLRDGLKSSKEMRRVREKELEKEGADTPYPGWDGIEAERREEQPAILLTVRDIDGEVVRRLTGPTKAGFHRVAWNLLLPSPEPLTDGEKEEWDRTPKFPAAPGQYTVTLSKRVSGKTVDLSEPMAFDVVSMRQGTLEGASPEEIAAFVERGAEVRRAVAGAEQSVKRAFTRIARLKKALEVSAAGPDGELDTTLRELEKRLFTAEEALVGNRSRQRIGEAMTPSVVRRLEVATFGVSRSTYGPTPTHRRSLEIAEEGFGELRAELTQIIDEDLPALEARMDAAGLPWTPGREVPAIR